MNFRQTLAVLAIAVILTGCDSSQPQSTTPPAKPHYQRFVPVPADGFFVEGIPWHGYFALDTKTGTLCSTIKDRLMTRKLNFAGASEWANGVPSCEVILGANPD
jgi:hypothetical protein